MPAFERCGDIYEFRLMMDFSGANRGYCFVTYTCREDARRAVAEMNNYEIRRGRFLGVCMSVDNCRLFVGGIPKDKQQVRSYYTTETQNLYLIATFCSSPKANFIRHVVT